MATSIGSMGCQRAWLNFSHNSSLLYCQTRGLVNVGSLYKHKSQKKVQSQEHLNVSYHKMMKQRRNQAERSVLVQLAVPGSEHQLYNHLRKLGKIRKAFHYEKEKKYLLVEFEKTSSIQNVYRDAGHFASRAKVPVQSRLLYFERSSRESVSESFDINYQDLKFPNLAHLKNMKSVSEQIESHHKSLCLGDLGSRLRFFICSALEDMISGFLPHLQIEPFGSSVNGFGWWNCDLDMGVTMIPSHLIRSESRLKFLTKKIHEDERVYSQQSLALFGYMLHLAMPTCYNVIKILNARIPIIKFHHQGSEVACDLSFWNGTGAKMSEVLYTFGQRDVRLQPLMSVLKHWARCKYLTKTSPGPWPTNFMLLMLLIHYFQHCRLLPGMSVLTTDSGSKDSSMSADSEKSLEDILKGFFEFYINFDFSTRAISLVDGKDFVKPSYSPLYIENPFEQEVNICKNVSKEELDRLRSEMENALVTLEDSNVKSETENWGIMKLFTNGDIKHRNGSTFDPKINVFRDLSDTDATDVQKFSVTNLYEGETSNELDSELSPLDNSELSTPDKDNAGESDLVGR